ncbi:MAG: hypothetical protein ACRD3O_06020 [Terriglobia bacterium]
MQEFPWRLIFRLIAAALVLAWAGAAPLGRGEGALLMPAIRETQELSLRKAVHTGPARLDAIPLTWSFRADAANIRGVPASPRFGPVLPIAAAAIPLSKGGRDPFRLPPPPPRGLNLTANGNRRPVSLPPGPRGLIISQLNVSGILAEDATHTMIAVVTNASNRAYFLRVGEELYDGVVTGITPAAVYFKQEIPGAGEANGHTVVKRLNKVRGVAR